jgi:hypothetical protein
MAWAVNLEGKNLPRHGRHKTNDLTARVNREKKLFDGTGRISVNLQSSRAANYPSG